ncbi:MAG: hypothetical protein EBZ47_08060 [Chlamydiae bacterium]|nr:hypothetical protein [Chlamydiota bacterium]
MEGLRYKDQVILLDAGLEEDNNESYRKFESWADAQDYTKDFSPTEYRLLPYIWHRHQIRFKGHAMFDRFQGVFKRTFFYNSRLLKAGIDISRILTDSSIEHAFVKGLNFMVKVYPSWGARPMNDIDLLINEFDLDKVGLVLERHGFFPKKSLGVVRFLKKNSIGFVSKEGIGVDVHIRPVSFPVLNFDAVYFLDGKELVETSIGKLPVLSDEKAIMFTVLNGLLEADGHWLLDILLMDREAQVVGKLLELVSFSNQLKAMVAYRLNVFRTLVFSPIKAGDVPPEYKVLLSKRMGDQPVKFRLLNYYWYLAMKSGKFRILSIRLSFILFFSFMECIG